MTLTATHADPRHQETPDRRQTAVQGSAPTTGARLRTLPRAPAAAPALSTATDESFSVPLDAVYQPLTEVQFAAVVRGYDRAMSRNGVEVYTRDGHPWKFTRVGDRIKAEHRFYRLPVGYYTIVS